MACKKALEEANGDVDKAIELLRKKGEAKAASRADRSTSNGVVAVAEGEGKTGMAVLACETDFVAKTDAFIAAAQELAQKVLENGQDYDASQYVSDLTIKLGEKIEAKDLKLIEGTNIGIYIHSNNKIGTAVVLSGGEVEMAKDIAMHVAAMNPTCLSPEDVSDEVIAKEKEIWTEQLKNEGKPEAMLENIMKGKEKKFREENALIKQSFVKNPEQTIEQLVGDLTLESFVRLSV